MNESITDSYVRVSPKKSVPIIRTNNGLGLVFGVWLFSIFFASIVGRSVFSTNPNWLYAILGCSIVWPVAYFVVSSCRFFPRAHLGKWIALTVFGLFALVSAAKSPMMMESTSYAAMTLLAIFIAMQFNSNLESAQFEIGLKLYSVLMTAILLWESYVSYTMGGYVSGGRLSFIDVSLNPNAIALVDMSVLLSAMLIRNSVLRWSIFSAALVPLIMTGSRASALGAIIGLAAVFFFRTKAASTKTNALVFIILSLVMVFCAVYLENVTEAGSNYFALTDPHRGIDSGATGRIYAWKETWRLFVDNPVLGVGFRAHEYYMQIGSSSHNGYLAILAEIGIFGFLAVMYLIGSSIFSLWKAVNNSGQLYTHSVLLGLILGYLFVAMFERYMLNVGNPTSLLFLVAITMRSQNLRVS